MLGNRHVMTVLVAVAGVFTAMVASQVAADLRAAMYLGNTMCLACHNVLQREQMQAYQEAKHSQAKPEDGNSGAELYRRVTSLKDDGTYAAPGVGCEMCHAPGSEHLKDVKDKTLCINPKNLPFDRAAMVCGQCHATGKTKDGLDYPKGFIPGDDLSAILTLDEKATGKFANYNEWARSLHAQHNTICTECHDPHGGGTTMLKDQTDNLCLRCHLEDGTGAGKKCLKPVADRGGRSCKDCHMPNKSHEVKKPPA